MRRRDQEALLRRATTQYYLVKYYDGRDTKRFIRACRNMCRLWKLADYHGIELPAYRPELRARILGVGRRHGIL